MPLELLSVKSNLERFCLSTIDKIFRIPIKKPVLNTDDVPKTSVSINGETALYLATVSKYLR